MQTSDFPFSDKFCTAALEQGKKAGLDHRLSEEVKQSALRLLRAHSHGY